MIKVLHYFPEAYKEFQVGFAAVEIKGKSTILVKVCRAKSGKLFCCSTAVKIGDKWVPALSMKSKEQETAFFDKVNVQVQEFMNRNSNVSEDPNPSENDLPF